MSQMMTQQPVNKMTTKKKSVNGILLLDKPKELTSNAALQRVKRLFNAKKAGHTGSLDPLATGMLPLCFGEATKFSQFLLESDKRYYVTGKLGVKTTTGDSEGEVIATRVVQGVTAERLKEVLAEFLGDITQIPPMYSAIKHQGKPLYTLARQGIEIERQPRPVHIFSIVLESCTEDTFTFVVHCSKGTYIRTLVEDMGEKLNVGAHVIALRRLSVTPYDQQPMYTMDQLEALVMQKASHPSEGDLLSKILLPVETAVGDCPAITLSTASAFYLRTGQAVRLPGPLTAKRVKIYDQNGQFLGVGEVLPDGRVKPERLVNVA